MKMHPSTRKFLERGPRLTTSEKAPRPRLTSNGRGCEPEAPGATALLGRTRGPAQALAQAGLAPHTLKKLSAGF